jgi:hypothetical protein
MFGNLWSLFCIDLAALASAAVVGVLSALGWLAVATQRPGLNSVSLIPVTTGVLFDSAVFVNNIKGEKFFPMTAYGGSLVPFFYKWQSFSFALILIAVVLQFLERTNLNRAARWGVIAQSAIHCCTVLLFLFWGVT